MEWQALAYKPLYTLLGDHLEMKIRGGEFPRGAYLPPVRDIMRLFKVSLSTVRGALDRLEERGLIARRQGSGVTVIFETAPAASTGGAGTLDVTAEVTDLFDLRAILEPAALADGFDRIDGTRLAGLAAAADPASREALYAVDQALHAAIVTRCANRALRRALVDVMNRIELFRELRFRHSAGSDAADLACVRDIIAAIAAADRDRAAAGLRAHITATRDSLLGGSPVAEGGTP